MNAVFYPAVFHPEETGYSVTVPDIEGCFTQGDTMDEAVRMAQDAIGLMLEECAVCPTPSVPSSLPVEAGDFVVMVPFDMAAYQKQFRPVKKTLSVPAWLNDAAEATHQLLRRSSGRLEGKAPSCINPQALSLFRAGRFSYRKRRGSRVAPTLTTVFQNPERRFFFACASLAA